MLAPTSTTRSNEFDHAMQATLHAVRIRFIESVLPRLLEFEALKQKFASDPHDMAPLSAIGAMAHRIAGVAETLGFGDIGLLSSRIDTEIVRGVNGQKAPAVIWQTVAAPLEEMLEKLENLLET